MRDEELRMAGLTEKELQVYKLAKIQGKRIREIARLLNKAPSTVSIQLSRAEAKLERYRKLQEMIRAGFEKKLKELEEKVELHDEVILSIIIELGKLMSLYK